MELIQITKQDAENIFNNGNVIYVQAEDLGLQPESYNTFMLSGKTWDASLNIYKGNYTPLQYGFEHIINWITARVNTIPLFYTFNSNQFLIIEANQ